jgi:hypothetical protein
VLKDARLVVDHAEGTRRVYQVDREGLALLRTYLDVLWSRALAGFEAAAAAPEPGLPSAEPGRPSAPPPTTNPTKQEER